MDIRSYQKVAAESDRNVANPSELELDSILNLTSSIASIARIYRKFSSKKISRETLRAHLSEKFGEIFFNLADAATRFNIELDAAASTYLDEQSSRLIPENRSEAAESMGFIEYGELKREQLPRKFKIEFTEIVTGDEVREVTLFLGKPIGDPLTDNSHIEDGYRFHDVFHFAYAAVLGWSPITRKFLGVKRKSSRKIDEVEDGARAMIIEELISQLVFNYARKHEYLENIGKIDEHLLATIHSLVEGREVASRSFSDWESAILKGYLAWRHLKRNRGGMIEFDLDKGDVRIIN